MARFHPGNRGCDDAQALHAPELFRCCLVDVDHNPSPILDGNLGQEDRLDRSFINETVDRWRRQQRDNAPALVA